MVKKFTIFAIMVTIAVAAPTFGGSKSSGEFGVGGSNQVSMSVSVGFNHRVSGGLEACYAGATSGCIDVGYKKDLGIWIKGEGKKYFDTFTCGEISKWCAGADYKIGGSTKAAMGAAFGIDSELSADGDPFAFFNWDVENGHNGADCACKAMAKGHQQSLQSFLIAEGAAIEKGIHGSLDLCASGGIAATLSTQALGSLKGWLSSSKCGIKSDLLDAVKGWCAIAKSDGYGSAHGKDHGRPNVVLSRSYQTKLSNFCGDSAFEGLDFPIQAGLKACASGGVAGSLDTSIQSAVSGFIKSKSCPLDSDLSASIGFWLSGQTGKGCESGTPPDAYGYISAGFAISGNFDTSGSLTAEAQASLSGFCGKAGAYVDASILNSLKHCAKGGLSAELGIGASADLSAWLGSSECSLDSELRASVMAWMSAGISGAGGAGVGISGGAGFAFDASAIGSISAGINASGKLSSTVKGALGVCTAGGVAGSVDFDARAELGAFLCSEDGTSVGVDIQGQLMGWLCGSDNSSHGSYKGHRSGKGLRG